MTEFKIYKGGKLGWVEDSRNGRSNNFICYNVSKKQSEISLGWDYEPTKKMIGIAKKKVAEYFKNNITTDFNGFL